MAVERAPKMYVARNGSRINNASAQIVGPELDELSRGPEGLTPAAVLSRATELGTALNRWDSETGYFEWNDTEAADKYRHEQARLLIRSIIVKVQSDEGTYKTRAFYNIRDNDQRSYKTIDEVAGNPEYIGQIKDRFQNELIRLDRTYRAYMSYVEFAAQYGPVFDAIVDVVPTIQAAPKSRSRYVRRGERVTLAAPTEATVD